MEGFPLEATTLPHSAPNMKYVTENEHPVHYYSVSRYDRSDGASLEESTAHDSRPRLDTHLTGGGREREDAPPHCTGAEETWSSL